MKHPYTRLLRDEELLRHLKSQEVIVFVGLAQKWKDIEHQVERLGFGGSYAVSIGKKRRRDPGFIRVSPVK
jgi:hypothetical protein